MALVNWHWRSLVSDGEKLAKIQEQLVLLSVAAEGLGLCLEHVASEAATDDDDDQDYEALQGLVKDIEKALISLKALIGLGLNS
ncbi:MAG: hypothetical protein A3I38_01100 [Candidatus Wildermuthbacteria bacterium RIFCSPLOWO2_02_FULL_47_10]|uniref:Uncharacterized protein n=1 Tax=Candidatus Wildermuthbacteria bacterium RIFCSPHIGHO2_02_FULL_47_17 TaxID=1802452 RepID=A0A1G2R6L1_9BACT|nr:MAG: hypothetical protein A3D59_02965 [Candidatus Wildermuthbacteria bacterium RIFCSPHIGHO2_02_FULL_47_17]OHA76264.1 MAG: hypothetical protein A3I38_01100 [Candidatus Wildermuthbacteria bacterium RIFCSPLOWO2_02_FULL_47_10]